MLNDKEIQDEVDRILSKLPPSINDLDADRKFLMPYIQHVPEEVDDTQYEFLKYCSKILEIDLLSKNWKNRHGIVGRYLDDCGNVVMSKTWYRFMCIDLEYREWCQPFYAMNYKDYKIDKCECVNNKYPELITYFRDKKIDILLK